MAIDTPARIAILGAGPIGLEAALYARYLGYEVDLYERGRVAQNVLRWGHVRMFTPFGANRSSLGRAALRAQDPGWQSPGDDEFVTGAQFAERYLVPLAQSDLLADSLHEQTEVVAIGREELLPGELSGDEARGEYDFRLILASTESGGRRRERAASADVVIDASGTFANHNWLGHGGVPAVGELAAQEHIEYGLPDVLDADRRYYASRNILLVGSGHSAATNLVALAELAAQSPDTWITWITREACDEKSPQPIAEAADDHWPERRDIARAAARLAADDANHVTFLSGTTVDTIYWHADLQRFSVDLLGKHGGQLEFDRVVANVGYHADPRPYAALDIIPCPINGGPGPLASVIAARKVAKDRDPPALRPEMLVQAEPHFYVLGAKSYGRDSGFLLSHGFEQIRELFALIGDRAELDLYATMPAHH